MDKEPGSDWLGDKSCLVTAQLQTVISHDDCFQIFEELEEGLKFILCELKREKKNRMNV